MVFAWFSYMLRGHLLRWERVFLVALSLFALFKNDLDAMTQL